MSDRDYLYGHVCTHGSLSRSCEVCDLQAILDKATDNQLDRARKRNDYLEAEVRRLRDGIRRKAEAWDRDAPDALAFRVTADFRTLIGDDDEPDR